MRFEFLSFFFPNRMPLSLDVSRQRRRFCSTSSNLFPLAQHLSSLHNFQQKTKQARASRGRRLQASGGKGEVRGRRRGLPRRGGGGKAQRRRRCRLGRCRGHRPRYRPPPSFFEGVLGVAAPLDVRGALCTSSGVALRATAGRVRKRKRRRLWWPAASRRRRASSARLAAAPAAF